MQILFYFNQILIKFAISWVPWQYGISPIWLIGWGTERDFLIFIYLLFFFNNVIERGRWMFAVYSMGGLDSF